MPTLPTLDSLGARPIPQSRRGVASNPGAGVVGRALEGFGETVGGIGKGMVEKEDRLAYAASRTKMLAADVAKRQELEKDPDYENWGTNYTQAMKTARVQASSLIQSRSDRALFEAEAEQDVVRGMAALAVGAQARRVDAGKATTVESLAALEDVGQNAPDDATREATIKNVADTIAAAQAKGYYSAEQAANLRLKWINTYRAKRVESLKLAGELDEARRYFEASRGQLDFATEAALEAQLQGAEEHRENLGFADLAVHSGPVVSGATPVAASTWSVISRPGAARDGGARVHQGYDIAPSAGNPGWHPTQDFRIERPRGTDSMRQGLTADVVFADGTKLTLMHLASLPQEGSYKAGQLAAIAGNTGNARTTPTHFHVEGHDKNGNRVDPSHYFAKGTGGAQQGPAEHDLNAVYATIDANADEMGWTPEKREAVKGLADRMVARDEQLLKRQEDEAFETAFAQADALGARFTDVSQLGAEFHKASRTDQARLRAIAAANATPKAVTANGDRALWIDDLQDRDPAGFAQTNLAQYRHELTPGEYAKALDDQRKISAQGPTGNHAAGRAAITGTINFYGPDIGIKGSDLEKVGPRRDRYMAIKTAMENEVRRVTENKRPPTDAELKGAFDRATMQVTERVAGASDRTIRRYEIRPNTRVVVSVPTAIKQRIINANRAAGRPSMTEVQIAQEYMNNKGREGFW